MTQASHTQGPWEAHTYYDNSVSVRHYLGMGLNQPVCEMLPGKTPEERNANARLIAAAPELLAALQDAVEALTEARYYPSEIKRLRAAIVKAKGS